MIDELRTRIRGKHIVIVGIGNSLRGDDGAGPALIARLHGHSDATLIDAGDVPENYFDVVRRAHPNVVLMIDAVELGAHAGDAAIIERHQIAGARATTHDTSLALFAQLAYADTSADIFLVGVQPQSVALGAALSPPVQATLDVLEQALRNGEQ